MSLNLFERLFSYLSNVSFTASCLSHLLNGQNWIELAELGFLDCPNKKTAGLAANLRQELEKAWLAKRGDNSQASCSDFTLGRLIENKSLVRLLTHTMKVWYIYLHLVDFFMVNVGKYISIPWILWVMML